jgi:hypothetical protein
MIDRLPASTIGELDIHLGNVVDRLDKIDGRLDALATRAYVDDKLARVREEIDRDKISNKIRTFAAWLVVITVILTFMGGSYQVIVYMQRLLDRVQTGHENLPAPIHEGHRSP